MRGCSANARGGMRIAVNVTQPAIFNNAPCEFIRSGDSDRIGTPPAGKHRHGGDRSARGSHAVFPGIPEHGDAIVLPGCSRKETQHMNKMTEHTAVMTPGVRLLLDGKLIDSSHFF